MRVGVIVKLHTAGLIALVLFCDRPAFSQAGSGESITVTGFKPTAKAIDDFIISHSAPTRVLGKLARWKTGICPVTVGIGAEYAAYISKRIREVAQQIGAPVNDDIECKPNIRVVLTTKPQELLDNLRRTQPLYLGYYENRAQLARLAAITQPIQSWYATATNDLRGRPQTDSSRGGGISMDVILPGPNSNTVGGVAMGATTRIELPNASSMNVTGNRLNDGLSSEFFNVLIVGEPAKLLDQEIGTLADYITMLALADPGALKSCAEFPTILNLLVTGCVRIAHNLTDGDQAYLKALYKMTPTNTLQAQRGEMRYQMQESLK